MVCLHSLFRFFVSWKVHNRGSSPALFARRNRNADLPGNLRACDYIPEKSRLLASPDGMAFGAGMLKVEFWPVKQVGSDGHVAPQHTENAT
ncbi:hypothetical protein TH2_02030 [Thalassospira profundimaris WP0211]|nr:hypothetical protein TH2_02030 [Thalassospira profundimaris WP0211]